MSSPQLDSLKAILKEGGYSLTKSRVKVFELLLDQKPQSMQVLVQRGSGVVDRATVYRTIELFEGLGVVRRINVGWKYKIELSDVFSGHHHHFYCTNCNRTYEIEANSMLETMINSAVAKDGYNPRGHQLEVYGLCPSCSGKG